METRLVDKSQLISWCGKHPMNQTGSPDELSTNRNAVVSNPKRVDTWRGRHVCQIMANLDYLASDEEPNNNQRNVSMSFLSFSSINLTEKIVHLFQLKPVVFNTNLHKPLHGYDDQLNPLSSHLHTTVLPNPAEEVFWSRSYHLPGSARMMRWWSFWEDTPEN